LREILERLQTTLVRFNYLGSDQKHAWSSVQLAGRIRVENGIIYYRFDKDLRNELGGSDLLAKLDIELYRHFTSVHAMVLYENTALYRDKGVTPSFTVDQWRALMNATGPATSTPGRFLDRVIRPAIEEVNAISDIRVEPIYETTRSSDKGGRPSVSAIAFRVTPAPAAALSNDASIANQSGTSDTQRRQTQVGGSNNSINEVVGSSVRGYAQHPVVSRLTAIGMHLLTAVRLLEDHGEHYVGLLVDLHDLQRQKIKHGPAWINAMAGRFKSVSEVEDALRQTPQPLPMGGATTSAPLSTKAATSTTSASESQDRGPTPQETARASAFRERLAAADARFSALDPMVRSAMTQRFLESIKETNSLIYGVAMQSARTGDDPMAVPMYRVAWLQYLDEVEFAASHADGASPGP
jgi:hypothetical protein